MRLPSHGIRLGSPPKLQRQAMAQLQLSATVAVRCQSGACAREGTTRTSRNSDSVAAAMRISEPSLPRPPAPRAVASTRLVLRLPSGFCRLPSAVCLSPAVCRLPGPTRVPPASRIFRSTRSSIQWLSHHSTGFTGVPCSSIVKCRWSPPARPVTPVRPSSGAFLHPVARLHADRRQVRVERLHAQAVIDDHAVAVDAEEVGKHHDAGVGDVDRRVLHRRQVEAQVHLAVDLLVAEEVGPLIGEPRLHLRVAELGERFAPQHLRLSSAPPDRGWCRRSSCAVRR